METLCFSFHSCGSRRCTLKGAFGFGVFTSDMQLHKDRLPNFTLESDRLHISSQLTSDVAAEDLKRDL